MAAIRLDSGRRGHSPWPRSQAVAAARTASSASSSPMLGMVPMTARAPVVALYTGEVTSSVLPLHAARREARGVRVACGVRC